MSTESRHLDRRLAAPTAVLAALFLAFLAGALNIMDDQPQTAASEIADSAAAPVDESSTESAHHLTARSVCVWGLLCLYPIFLMDSARHVWQRRPGWRRRALLGLFPPLRLCGRDSDSPGIMWLPLIGWHAVDDELRERVRRGFSLPMIGAAFLVLPFIAAEFFWSEADGTNNRVELYLDAGTAFIWWAFTLEFIVMISIVEDRFRYCKEHWIDIVVICLPLVAFLRTFRLARLFRLNNLAKTVRAYRLRGTMLRAYRGILVLEIIQRLLRRNPEKRLVRLREEIELKEAELAELRSEMAELMQEVSIPKAAKTAGEAA